MKGQKPLAGSKSADHAALGLMKHFQHCNDCGSESGCLCALTCEERVAAHVWMLVNYPVSEQQLFWS